MGALTEQPRVTIETTYIHPEPQKLAKYHQKKVESKANSQGAAAKVEDTEMFLASVKMTSMTISMSF